jgi:hypothetical protein
MRSPSRTRSQNVTDSLAASRAVGHSLQVPAIVARRLVPRDADHCVGRSDQAAAAQAGQPVAFSGLRADKMPSITVAPV